MKRPVIIAVLLAAIFLSACGCPPNLTGPVTGGTEKSVIPAPEQSIPMHTPTPGDASETEGGWELYNSLTVN